MTGNETHSARTWFLSACPLAVLIAVGGTRAAEKENLLEDGASFEVGEDGFSFNRRWRAAQSGHSSPRMATTGCFT